MMDKRDELIVKLVDEINPRVDSHQYDLVVEALECVGYPVKVIMDYLSGDAVLGTVHPDTAQTERDAEVGDAPSVNVIAAYVGELEATVASLQAERDELARNLAAAKALLPCPDCEGDGVIAVGFDNDPNVYEAIESECPRCKGTGKYTATPQPAYAPTRELVAAEIRTALKDIESMADDAQGEWSAVELVYAPEWTHAYKRIGDVAAAALKGE